MKIFITLLLIVPQMCFACSCRYERSMKDVFDSSESAFLGEVIEVKKIGNIVKTGNEQDYRVSVKPSKVFKGDSQEIYQFEGSKFFNADDADKIIIGGCGLSMQVGDEYIVLFEKEKKIRISWCSEHILPVGSRKYDYFIKNFSKSSNQSKQ